MKLKYLLFCTVTMERYERMALSEYEARKNLAMELNVPLSCVDVFR